MNDAAALADGISRWIDAAAGAPQREVFALYRAADALCDRYLEAPYNSGSSDCAGCPIRERTGRFRCEAVPLAAANAAHRQWRRAVLRRYPDRPTVGSLAAFEAGDGCEFEHSVFRSAARRLAHKLARLMTPSDWDRIIRPDHDPCS